MNSEKLNELRSLASRYADGELDPSGVADLTRILAEDPAAIEEYVDLLSTHSDLILVMAGGQHGKTTRDDAASKDVSTDLSSSLDRMRSAKTLPNGARSRTWLAIVASLLLGMSYLLGRATSGLDGYSLGRDATVADGEDVTSDADTEKEVATITGGINPRFGGGLSLGSRLTPGILRLDSGVAQISFDLGAVMVLEGPAELEVVDLESCRLISGALSANVLPEGSGFSVSADGIHVVEHNHDARFGLRTGLSSGESEFHALGGNVELADHRGNLAGSRRRLQQGEAVRWLGDGNPTAFASDPTAFVTQQEIARQQHQIGQQEYVRWLNYSRRWFKDPAVVLRYDFGPSEDGIIMNSANATLHQAKAQHVWPRWGAGRWNNKKAMLFDGRSDVLHVEDHPDLRLTENLSLAIWLRTDNYPKKGWTRIVGKGYGADRNFGIWMQHKGCFKWQVCPDANPKSQEDWDRFTLYTDATPLDQWLFVVGVIDEGRLKVFVDGELQNTCPAPTEIATNTDRLTIGFYDYVDGHADFFYGRIDEVLLLNRALSDSEIREMYEVGRPTIELQKVPFDVEPLNNGPRKVASRDQTI